MENLEKEIDNIKNRNKRVELDKAWETSFTRKICIMILTYIVVVIYFKFTCSSNWIFLVNIIIKYN